MSNGPLIPALSMSWDFFDAIRKYLKSQKENLLEHGAEKDTHSAQSIRGTGTRGTEITHSLTVHFLAMVSSCTDRPSVQQIV